MRRTKQGAWDKKYKDLSEIERSFWQQYGALIGVTILGFMAGGILATTLWSAFNPEIISPKGSGVARVPQVLAKEPEPYCGDEISYIRCSGTKIGKTNREIQTMILIAKCESGLRHDAIGKNTNGTFDLGVMQINDVHNKRISREDRLDFRKNIDFAWQLQTEQGFSPWTCYKKIQL